jgi:hypothetical protein
MNSAGVSYTLLPWFQLLFVQQTKELSRGHKICCLNELVLGYMIALVA